MSRLSCHHLFPFAAAVGAMIGPAHLAAQTTLVIYRDGGVQVTRTLPVAIPKGKSEHQIDLDQYEPGTLVSLDDGVSIAGIQYPRHLSEESLLLASVGHRVLFLRQDTRDTVSAVVLAEPLRFQLSSGHVQLSAPGIPLFPKDLSGRSTVLQVESARSMPKLSLGYLTSGATWQAEYAIHLNGQDAEVSGRVVLQSTELRMDSAEVHVLEGRPLRAAPFQREGSSRSRVRPDDEREDFRLFSVRSSGAVMTPAAVVGGFRVYAVPGRHALVPGRATVVPLFSPLRVSMQAVYRVDGGQPQPGAGSAALPVETRYLFDRPRETPFGAQALPPGIVRIYGKVGDTQLLLGEVSVQHLDPGLELDLGVGSAVHLMATRVYERPVVVQDSIREADGRARHISNASVFDTHVRLANTSDTAVTIEYTQAIPESWRLVSSSVPGSRDPRAGSTRFRVAVPARGETTLEFRLRTSP